MSEAPIKTCDYCSAVGEMPTFMDGETICYECMKSLPKSIRECRKEISILRRALDDLGVTPEEARAGAERSKAKDAEIARLRDENESLRGSLEEWKLDLNSLRDENARMQAERDHARLCYDRAVRILTGIHALLYPPRFTDHDGRTWQFKSPLAEEQMQELSDRIRALPDEIAAIDAAMQKGE